MFEQLKIPVLGVVENMSSFVCEHGQEYDIFGKGGAEAWAKKAKLPFLGRIPIIPRIRVGGDQGMPIAVEEDSPVSTVFDELAQAVLSGLERHTPSPVIQTR